MTKVKYTGTCKIVENWQPKPQPTAEQSYRRAMRGLTKAWKGQQVTINYLSQGKMFFLITLNQVKNIGLES